LKLEIAEGVWENIDSKRFKYFGNNLKTTENFRDIYYGYIVLNFVTEVVPSGMGRRRGASPLTLPFCAHI